MDHELASAVVLISLVDVYGPWVCGAKVLAYKALYRGWVRVGLVAEVAHCNTQLTLNIPWMVSISMDFLPIIIMKPEIALKRLPFFFRPSAFLLIFGGKSSHLALQRKL